MTEVRVEVGPVVDLPTLALLGESATRLVIGESVRALLVQRRGHLETLMAHPDARIYGATTGVGSMKSYHLPERERLGFNDRMIREHAAGFGPLVNPRITRMVMGIRVIELVQGGSGISLSSFMGLVEAYNRGIVPAIPSLGSLGEADVTILAHIARVLQGEGLVWHASLKRQIRASVALRRADLHRMVPLSRDGLALIGGNSYTLALLVETLQHLYESRDRAMPVMALGWAAWRANPATLKHEALVHAGPMSAKWGADLSRWLMDTPIIPRDLQDPLSWRCIPQVHGAMEQVVSELALAVVSVVNAARDNPAVLESGEVVSTGNFDITELTLRIDAVRQALLRVISLAAQRVNKFLNAMPAHSPS